MIALLLTVVMCSGTGQTVSECAPGNLAVYDVKTWVGPTTADMEDCVSQMQTLNYNGNNAKCQIVSAESDDYENVASAAKPAPQKWIF